MMTIEEFVGVIIRDLVKQREQLPFERLKESLPLDSTGGGAVTLMTHELYHPGKDAELFFEGIKAAQRALDQDTPIFCCAATSGLGKTRLAYATGKFLTLILVRVADKPVYENPFTAPWSDLCKKLTPLNQQRLEKGSSEEISFKTLLYIKILVCCYVDATVRALEIGQSTHELDTPCLRQLALRFHRNYTGERLIQQIFESKCNEIVDESDSMESMISKYRDYRGSVDRRFRAIFGEDQNESLLLCFDEAQELLGRYPRLFDENSKCDCEGAVDDRLSGDLFYGVACAIGSLSRHCRNWAMLMTGTHLSIAKLGTERKVSSSLLRNRIQEVPIRHSLLTSYDMRGMLQYYWRISDDVFTEPVMDALDKFRGRPYFFVEFVFRSAYVTFQIFNAPLTSNELLSLCNDSLRDVTSNIYRRIVDMFSQDSGDRTASSLLPILIKSTICGSGSLLLRCDAVVSQAIISGVVLASSLDTEVNIMETEPLVHDALTHYLNSVPADRIMHLVLDQISNDSGATAEEMFAYWIALQTYCHVAKRHSGVLLGDLLRPLYDGPNEELFPGVLLNEYECTATKVVNLNNADFITALSTNDSAIDGINTDTIFFGINSFCGADIVFVVKSRFGNCPKLVAIQSKNDKCFTVKEILMNLSPGLQYLENSYREFIITGEFPNKLIPNRRSCGPGFDKWEEWQKFCTTYDSTIGDNWIRVALVSQHIPPEIHQFVSADRIVERYHEKTTSVYWRLFSSYERRSSRIEVKERAELASYLSPLVFLSMSSKTWLTEDLKRPFISIKSNDEDMRLPREGKKSIFWVPVSVAETEEKLSSIAL